MINQLLHRLLKHIDTFLMGCLLFTMLVGLFVLYSASGQSVGRVLAQAVNIAVALVAMWLVANIQPHHLERAALPLYIVGVLLLIGVALFGEVSHGARRWLNLGVTKIQPSEIMRLAMPMMIAWYFSSTNLRRIFKVGVSSPLSIENSASTRAKCSCRSMPSHWPLSWW